MRDFLLGAFVYFLFSITFFLPLRMKSSFIGWVLSVAFVRMGSFRKRAFDNFDIALKNMQEEDRLALLEKVGRNAGKTATEIVFNKQFKKTVKFGNVTGDGLAALQSSKKTGKGGLIISAHFGQWEAIRHYLLREGMETGAVYKPLSNKWLRDLWRKGIEHGGIPLVDADAAGTMQMMRHVKSGGFMAVLIDQKFSGGEMIDFMGKPALTSTAVAKLATKLNVPIVPAFAKRRDTGEIDIEFLKELEHGDEVEIMREANRIISKKIQSDPEHWFWLHRRWKMN